MATKPHIPDWLSEDGAPEPGYEVWKEAEIRAALAEADGGAEMIPAEQVWRELGLED